MASVCPESGVDGNHHSDSMESQTSKLGASAQEFLDHLRLPMTHPRCNGYAQHGNANGSDDFEAHRDDLIDLMSRIGMGSIFELPTKLINGVEFSSNTTSTTAIVDTNAAPGTILEPSQLLTTQFLHESYQHLLLQQASSPTIGPMLSLLELHDHSISQLLFTAATMLAPTIAMMELCLRFFAVFLCPLCLCCMIQWEIQLAISKSNPVTDSKVASLKSTAKMYYTAIGSRENDTAKSTTVLAICIVGLASSAVLFTDTLYVFEYGRRFGMSLFILSSIMAVRCAAIQEMKHAEGNERKSKGGISRKIFIFRCVIILLIASTTVLCWRSDGGHAMEASIKRFAPQLLITAYQHVKHDANFVLQPKPRIPNDPGIDLPTINEGLYHSSSNTLISSIVSNWPNSSRTYNIANGATPYLVTGDQRTGVQFLVNQVEEQEYIRVWQQNKFDGEYSALDIAFPYSNDIKEDHSNDENVHGKGGLFVHDLTKPVYLVLHGLNGGSHEEYVKDFTKRRRSEGSTVIVMIARGMMDTTLVGWNVFHGARTGDVDAAARALRRGLTSLAEAHHIRPEQRQILAGVGYSMGAIILSNYVARSGTRCALDAAIAISGALDMCQQINFKRSMRLWQPFLTSGMRVDNILGKFADQYRHRLTKEQFLGVLRATSLSALEVDAIVTYNSFDDQVHYCSEMSAMGDREPEFQLFGTLDSGSREWGRIANVSVPFAVVQALDDPIVGWRTLGTNDLQGLVNSGSGNVMLVLTKSGGHVGWPLGYNPAKSSFKWMNNAARDFVLAVDIAKHQSVDLQSE